MRRSLLWYSSVIAAIIFSLVACKKEKNAEANNKAPVAVAGSDQLINLPMDSAVLNGSVSIDPDGTISSFLWTKIAGPDSFNLTTRDHSITVARNLVAGTYHFELKIADNGGLSARDTMKVIVIDPTQPNRPPVAHAGLDQTIALPTNSIQLNGSSSTDPDNNITGYLWTKISGPLTFNIVNASAAQTPVTALAQGLYEFELKITDAGGLFSKDTVHVTVIPQSPMCTDCRIAFVSDRDGNPEIYSSRMDGSDIHRLTSNAANDDQPSWSPDKTKIAFISDRTGHPELYVMNSDGSNVIRKTFYESYTDCPSWSPDGTKVLYSTMSNGSANIWMINLTNGISSLVFQAPGWDDKAVWSPNGTKIALVSDWAAYDFVYDLYTINVDGTGFTALTGNIFDHLDYLNPSWSPNGNKLAFAISQTTGIDQYNTQVGIMNADGSGGIIPLISAASTWTRTCWSADGSRIIYTSSDGSSKNVSWVSVNGTSSGIIITNGWNADCQH